MHVQVIGCSLIMKRGQSEIRVSPVGAVSNTLSSNLPSSPHRYRPRVPPSHCTSADLPPSPTSTSVPTLPSPPSWSSQHQSGPRTRRRPKQSSISLHANGRGMGGGAYRGLFLADVISARRPRPARPCDTRSEVVHGAAQSLYSQSSNLAQSDRTRAREHVLQPFMIKFLYQQI